MSRRKPPLAFDTIRIEGGLLAAEWLGKVAALAAPHQTPADYGIPKGLQLRDELGRFWAIARAHHAEGGAPTTFVTGLLREAFGFTDLSATAPVTLEGRTFPLGFAARGGRVPVVIAGPGLDAPLPDLGDTGRRRSPFGLVQEYLNADGDALWGLVSDGHRLRLVRDNASLTRPAWIEIDLDRLFAEQRFADFAAVWLLLHASRFGGQLCPLEAWRTAGREEGSRALGQLRTGVEQAILALGTGFLAHPDNATLRAALEKGALSRTDYFTQLLRLAYRLIFLLTVEERGLLHPKGTSEATQALYREGYGLRRLRDRAARRSAHDAHHDLWEGLKQVLTGLAEGEPRLGLPALAGLFHRDRCPALDGAKLSNSALLMGLFHLGWLREKAGLTRVNWRDLGHEERGGIYEGLLELVPEISIENRTFRFADTSRGNARKTTGSYYTPDSLVQVLLDSALEPVVKATVAANPQKPVDALLQLAIVDPACGSGHFLLAAADRLAAHVARLEVGGTPGAEDYRKALRKVVARCIYGVDLNPLAVELCQVALWMEAVEPGRPSPFLESRIQHGNALLGTTPELMANGIPDAAFDPLEGDDKAVAKDLKKRNKKESGGQQDFSSLFLPTGPSEADKLAQGAARLDAASDEDLSALRQKEAAWGALRDSPEWRHQKLVADAWCAAFVWRKQPELYDAAPTHDTWKRLEEGRKPAETLVKEVEALATQYQFFHWHLAFPTVFKRGGFDVVLGNPPWGRVKLQEQEFFAPRSPEIAGAPNAAARKRLIAALPGTDPHLWQAWCAASREAEGQSHFLRSSDRYPLCGKGDINTYAIFAEHNRNVLAPRGRAGFIVPPGLATDDTTKAYFQSLIADAALVSLYEFENEEFLFPGVDHRVRFIAIAISGVSGGVSLADISFGNRSVAALAEPQRHFTLSPEDFATLNPNTRTCPTFRSRRDADLNLAMYRHAGILWRENHAEGNPWRLRFMAMLHMANDSGLFRTRRELEAAGWQPDGNHFVLKNHRALPLIEAKMVHQFDHRYGTYEGQTDAQANQGKLPELDDTDHADPHRLTLPQYWVDAAEVAERLEGKWDRDWLLGWRDICRSTDQRTVIASLIPRAAVGHKFPLALTGVEPRLVAALYANLCSFALDYAARQKVGGTSLTYFIIKQLPVLPPHRYLDPTPWHPDTKLRDWLLPRVLELTYTAWDLEPFAQDCGHEAPPFRWDPQRRPQLRVELDAAFFHLYALSKEDTAYILDTFPVVQKNEEKAHGEYRTKRLILETFDAMAEAARTGTTYVSPLNPPPADPAQAHPPRADDNGAPT